MEDYTPILSPAMPEKVHERAILLGVGVVEASFLRAAVWDVMSLPLYSTTNSPAAKSPLATTPRPLAPSSITCKSTMEYNDGHSYYLNWLNIR